METKTPQDIAQYQEHYSESGLFAKIGKVCKKAGIKAIYYVLLLYYVLMYFCLKKICLKYNPSTAYVRLTLVW